MCCPPDTWLSLTVGLVLVDSIDVNAYCWLAVTSAVVVTAFVWVCGGAARCQGDGLGDEAVSKEEKNSEGGDANAWCSMRERGRCLWEKGRGQTNGTLKV